MVDFLTKRSSLTGKDKDAFLCSCLYLRCSLLSYCTALCASLIQRGTTPGHTTRCQVRADNACSQAHPRPEDLAQGSEDAEYLPHAFEGCKARGLRHRQGVKTEERGSYRRGKGSIPHANHDRQVVRPPQMCTYVSSGSRNKCRFLPRVLFSRTTSKREGNLA